MENFHGAAGEHHLTAIAFKNSGGSAISQPISVTIAAGNKGTPPGSGGYPPASGGNAGDGGGGGLALWGLCALALLILIRRKAQKGQRYTEE